jgi:hypothetical protein
MPAGNLERGYRWSRESINEDDDLPRQAGYFLELNLDARLRRQRGFPVHQRSYAPAASHEDRAGPAELALIDSVTATAGSQSPISQRLWAPETL